LLLGQGLTIQKLSSESVHNFFSTHHHHHHHHRHQRISGSRPNSLYFHPTYLLWTQITTRTLL